MQCPGRLLIAEQWVFSKPSKSTLFGRSQQTLLRSEGGGPLTRAWTKSSPKRRPLLAYSGSRTSVAPFLPRVISPSIPNMITLLPAKRLCSGRLAWADSCLPAARHHPQLPPRPPPSPPPALCLSSFRVWAGPGWGDPCVMQSSTLESRLQGRRLQVPEQDQGMGWGHRGGDTGKETRAALRRLRAPPHPQAPGASTEDPSWGDP